MNFYENTIEELIKRIKEVFKNHPELVKEESCSCLYGVKEFECEDLAPSYFQVSWAFLAAKEQVG